MANPQAEDGFTAIANEIMEALISADLSGHEFRLALLIIRKTYGFKKIEDSVALSQMITATGLSKTRCSQVINRLQLRKIVTVTENINGIGKKYKFNKDFDKWETVTEKCNRYRKVKSTVTENCNEPLQKSVSTKETLTKETSTKENNNKAAKKSKADFVFIRPDWIPESSWRTFDEMRTKIKKPLTPWAAHLICLELQKIKEKHNHDPVSVLNQSIRLDYQDVYPLKNGGNNGAGNTRPGFNSSTGKTFEKTGGAKSDGEPWPADREY